MKLLAGAALILINVFSHTVGASQAQSHTLQEMNLSGTSVTSVSDNGTLAGNSHSALVSEWSIKHYIDSVIARTATAVTRPINSATWTISSTKSASVAYYIRITATATIGGAQSGIVELQYSLNGGSTWSACGMAQSSNTVSLAVVLNSSIIQSSPIVATIPSGALCRMVSTGSATMAYIYGFETY